MAFEELSCDAARDLISARIDDELLGDDALRLDAHVATCARCVAVAGRMAALDRSVRLRPAEPVPDLRAPILARSRPAVLGRGGWMRPALVWVSIVLVVQNAVALFAGRLDGAETHLARHLGAFGVALGIGLLVVAWRPHRAHGMLPFVAALIFTMLASATFDIIDNGRSAVSEAVHLTEIAGLVIVWMMAGSPGWPKAGLRFGVGGVRRFRRA